MQRPPFAKTLTDWGNLWIAFPLLGGLAALGLLVGALPFDKTKKRTQSLIALFWFASLFFAFSTLNGLIQGPTQGLYESLLRMLPFWAVIAVAYFGRGIRISLNFQIAPWIAFTILFLASIESALYGQRPTLLVGNPLVMGTALCLLVYCCTFEIASQSTRHSILGALGALSCLIAMAILIKTRIPFVVALSVMTFQLAAQLALTGISSTPGRRQVLFLCLILAGGLAGAATEQRFVEATRMLTAEVSGTSIVSSTSHTMNERLLLWTGAQEAIANKPLLGYGPQNRASVSLNNGSQETQQLYTHLHSTYFTNLVAGGIIGLGLLLTSLIVPLVLTVRSLGLSNRISILFLAVATSFGLNGLTNVVVFESTSAFLLGLSFVIIASQEKGMLTQ